jgi:hypothetical protein
MFDDYEKMMRDSFNNSVNDISQLKTDKNIFINWGEKASNQSNLYFMEDVQYASLINEKKYHEHNIKLLEGKGENYTEYLKHYSAVSQMTLQEKQDAEETIKTGSLSGFTALDKGRALVSAATGKGVNIKNLNNILSYKKIKELEDQKDLKLFTQEEIRKNATRDVNNKRAVNEAEEKQQASLTGQFFGNFAAMLDPVNAATIFVPVGGQYAAGIKHMKNVLQTGGNVAKTKAGYAVLDNVSGELIKNNLKGFGKSAMEVGLKNAALSGAAEVYNQYNHVMPYRSEYLGDNYSVYDAWTNIGFAAGGGFLFGTIFEGLGNIKALRQETSLKKDFEELEELVRKSDEIKTEYNIDNPNFANAVEDAVEGIMKRDGGDVSLETREVLRMAKQLYDNEKALDQLVFTKDFTVEGKVDFEGKPLLKDEVIDKHNEALTTAILQYNATGEVSVGNIINEQRSVVFSNKIDELTADGNPTGLDEKTYNFLKTYNKEIKENMQYKNVDEVLDDVDRYFEVEEKALYTIGKDKYDDIIMNDKDLEKTILDYRQDNPDATSFELKRVIADYVDEIIEMEKYKNMEVFKMPQNNLSIQNKKMNAELKKNEVITDDDILDIAVKSEAIKNIKNKTTETLTELTEEEKFLKELMDEYDDEFDFINDFDIIEKENRALDDLLECSI